MKLILILLILKLILLNNIINCKFNLESKRNIIGYYSNSLKVKGLKYHSLGEFCSSGYYDSIIVGALFWNQNLTEFYFDCQDFESINQDKINQNSSEDPDSEATSQFKKYDYSKVQKVSKENQLPSKSSTKLNLEKNTILTNKCIDLRNDIELCQSLGVKILVSIGGRHGTVANTTITSAENAQKLAIKIWDMFLFGDNGRKAYKEQQLLIQKKEEEKRRKQLEAEENGDVASSSDSNDLAIDDYDYFDDESLSKEESDSSDSDDDYLIDENEYSDSYYDEYSDDDGTLPPVVDDDDNDFVDEEAYSDSDYYASDQYDSSGNKVTRKPRVFSSKKKTIKKKAPVFTPRPFGYDIFLNGVDLSPLVGRSDYYLHLANALDNYRIPRRDIFLISATLDCSVLHSKKENIKATNSILKFNFDFLNLDFVHNKQCDYWSKISDQTIIDWSTYSVKNKFNQTKIVLQVSSNSKDSAYFAPSFFLMEYTQYCYDLPNMAGAYITDVLGASKIINSTSKIDFAKELSSDLRKFDPSTRKFSGTRPPFTYGNHSTPLKTKEPIIKKPVTHAPIKSNSTKSITKPTKKPVDIIIDDDDSSSNNNIIIDDNSISGSSGSGSIGSDSFNSNDIIIFDDSSSGSSNSKPKSTTKPSTTKPSTTKPSTTKPSTTKPSTTKPSTTKPSTTKKPIIKPTHKPIKSDSSIDTIILDSSSNGNNNDVIIFDDSDNSKEKSTATKLPVTTKSPNTKKPAPTKAPITKKPSATKVPQTPSSTPKLRPTHKPIAIDFETTPQPISTPAPTKTPVTKKPITTKAPVTKIPTTTKAPPPSSTPKLRPTHKPIAIDFEVTPQPTTNLNEETKVPIPTEDSTLTRIISKEPTFLHTQAPKTEIPTSTQPPTIIPQSSPPTSQAPIQSTSEDSTLTRIISKEPTFLHTQAPRTEIPTSTQPPTLIPQSSPPTSEIPTETQPPPDNKFKVVTNAPIFMFTQRPTINNNSPIPSTSTINNNNNPSTINNNNNPSTINNNNPSTINNNDNVISPNNNKVFMENQDTVKSNQIEQQPQSQPNQPVTIQNQINEEPAADENIGSRRAGRHKPISATEFNKNFIN